LSTLTKILIVLLTLSSIYLAAIVGIYVSHAQNYRQLSDDLTQQRDTAVNKRSQAEQTLEEKKADYQTLEDQLKDQINNLQIQVAKLDSERKLLEVDKTKLEERIQGWVAMTNTLTKTTEEQGLLLKNKLEELRQAEDSRIKLNQQLEDVTKQLMEKVAVIDTLNTEKRQLEEERAALREQLQQYQFRIGKEPAPAPQVTPEPAPVPAAALGPEALIAPEPRVRDIGLKGLITAIDFNNSLAEVSIGAAQGVANGMRFYVIRGDQFICEISIFSVDTEKAVGVLERVRYQPKVGDQVSTNL